MLSKWRWQVRQGMGVLHIPSEGPQQRHPAHRARQRRPRPPSGRELPPVELPPVFAFSGKFVGGVPRLRFVAEKKTL